MAENFRHHHAVVLVVGSPESIRQAKPRKYPFQRRRPLDRSAEA